MIRHVKSISQTRAAHQTCACVSQVCCANLNTQYTNEKRSSSFHTMNSEANKYQLTHWSIPQGFSKKKHMSHMSHMSKRPVWVLTGGRTEMYTVAPCPCHLHPLVKNKCWQWFGLDVHANGAVGQTPSAVTSNKGPVPTTPTPSHAISPSPMVQDPGDNK